MNSLLLFVNPVAQSSNELLPFLMTKLAVGLAIFAMLFFISRISYQPKKMSKTRSNS